MTEFSLKTIWHIPAPVESVWNCLIHTESWPDWWKYVESVQEIEPGSPEGILNKRGYRWRTCLPYSLYLEMTVTQLVPCKAIAVTVTGDLNGSGRCRVFDESKFTRVEFHWQVQTSKPWMNRFSPLTKSIFEWNHDRVMQQGEQGLIEHLSALKNQAIT